MRGSERNWRKGMKVKVKEVGWKKRRKKSEEERELEEGWRGEGQGRDGGNGKYERLEEGKERS